MPTVAQRQATAHGRRAYAAHLNAPDLLATNVVFYRGLSLLTGDPIIGLAGRRSSNLKTGPVVQTWILRADMTPIEAVKTGGDAAICGDCRMRGDGTGKARSCYVQYFWAPNNLYRALHQAVEKTPEELAGALARQHLRIGTYGDPVAVPVPVWRRLLSQVSGWTGYTHQWRTCDRRYQSFLMASVDSAEEQVMAHAMGWRTFRVRLRDEPLLQSEVVCPASDEAENKATCHTCGLCRGTERAAKSVAIVVHGPSATNFVKTHALTFQRRESA